MPKQYSCCVPACQSRGPYTSFVIFPTDPTTRQQWISAIPNLDCVVHHKSLICKNHFKNNEVKSIGYNLVVDAQVIPSIFSQTTHPVKKRKYFPKFMFEIIERDVGPETFGDLEYLVVDDFIVGFFNLKKSYKEKLGQIMANWQASFTENYACFYFLSMEDVAKIKCSIKIDEMLMVQVSLNGRVMDPLDLTWILPASSKITRWSQLKMLLFEFGVGETRMGD